MEIQFPESFEVQFPSNCACCMARTDDSRLSYRHALDFRSGDPKTQTKKLPVPYCRACRDHVDWKEGGGFLGLFLSVPVNGMLWGGLVAILTMMWQMGSNWAYERESFTTGVGVAVWLVLVGFLTWRRFSKRPSGGLHRGHTRGGESVEIMGYRAGGSVKIRIHNPQWAELFQGANPRLFPAG